MSKRTLPVSAPIIFVLLLFLVGPAALLQGNNPLLWMLCVFVVIGLGTLLTTRLILGGLQVRRVLPDHGAVGEPLVVGYEISRMRRWLPAFDVTVTERSPGLTDEHSCPAWILHVGPRETVHGEGVFVPLQRGRLQFNLMEIRTGFPLGIIPRRRSMSVPQDVLVHPAIIRLRSNVVRSIVGSGAVGRRGVNRHGNGLDYFGTRPVRTGDGLRDIAWKISARRDSLVAIERARPSAPRLRVVLDLSTPTDKLQVSDDEAIPARELEERAISLAASILRDASGRGYDAGLSVQGIRTSPHQLRGGTRHFGRMLATLADLDLDQDRRPWASLPERERAGLVVIHPDRVRRTLNRQDAWHLTARQLDELRDPSTEESGSSEEAAA
ncbi:MAG: DUF58 domain-containing protein [Phycisphaerales bacterium]|nr:DUF58 domain-containing protein [Phycisphaerales bacterium]